MSEQKQLSADWVAGLEGETVNCEDVTIRLSTSLPILEGCLNVTCVQCENGKSISPIDSAQPTIGGPGPGGGPEAGGGPGPGGGGAPPLIAPPRRRRPLPPSRPPPLPIPFPAYGQEGTFNFRENNGRTNGFAHSLSVSYSDSWAAETSTHDFAGSLVTGLSRRQ
jgi:hypothetical protein